MHKIVRYVIAVSMALILSACGFTLRESQALPDSFSTVVINSAVRHSGLVRALQERMPIYQLKPVFAEDLASLDDKLSNEGSVTISLSPEKYERTLLSVFTSGQVAEYELVYTINYSVQFPERDLISHSMNLSRQYQDDPDQILAKSRELQLVLQDLRNEAADRIIRRLSSQYSQSINLVNAEPGSDKSEN